MQVILRMIRDRIQIEVNDNGNGFDKEKINLGLGLTNLFNRVRHYNGEIEIESEPGKGCRLRASMPYK